VTNAGTDDKIFNFWTFQAIGWGGYLIFYNVVFNLLNGRFYPERLFWNALLVLTGFAISVVMRYIYRQFELKSQSILRLLLKIILITFIGANVWSGLDRILDLLVVRYGIEVYPVNFYEYLKLLFMFEIVLFSWSMMYFGLRFWREWIAQHEIIEKANFLRHKAQLQMLRYQLNPHFLFNTLNSVRALIEEDEQQAREMITELSEFLHYSLLSENQLNVPLRKEIEAVRHYFAIEKKRYEEKIEVNFDIEKAAEEYPVISFILHPLVENAIRNGMLHSPLPLRIDIKAQMREDTLRLEVWNTGRWSPVHVWHQKDSLGRDSGMENIQKRLDNVFPGSHRIDILENGERMCVRLEITRKSNPKSKIPFLDYVNRKTT